MLRKILIVILRILSIIVLIFLLYFNYKLYYTPQFSSTSNHRYNIAVLNQLNYLEEQIKDSEDIKMQQIFPEGYVFMNSLYALAWIDLIQSLDTSSTTYIRGIKQINWALEKLYSEKAKSTFNRSLPLEFGIFYQGWTNFVLGKKIELQSKSNIKNLKNNEIFLFKQNCEKIAKALKESPITYLESYSEEIWPADNIIGIATLALHDRIFKPKYKKDIESIIIDIKKRLDPDTKLIPHKIYFNSGKTVQGARGSSQSLILNFLIDIDKEFALSQFIIYKRTFVKRFAGLPGIREFPIGCNKKGDIDSGPLVFGFGGSATIVGQRTFGKFGDIKNNHAIRNSIEALGASYSAKNKKKYFLGKLPIADAFIAWSNSLNIETNNTYFHWRLKFQLLSIALIMGLILINFRFLSANHTNFR